MTALIAMGAAVRSDFWFFIVFGGLALISLWYGLGNAEKMQ